MDNSGTDGQDGVILPTMRNNPPPTLSDPRNSKCSKPPGGFYQGERGGGLDPSIPPPKGSN